MCSLCLCRCHVKHRKRSISLRYRGRGLVRVMCIIGAVFRGVSRRSIKGRIEEGRLCFISKTVGFYLFDLGVGSEVRFSSCHRFRGLVGCVGACHVYRELFEG